jgi:hypothetical protein
MAHWREGPIGTRMIRVSTSAEDTVSTVSIVGTRRSNGSGGQSVIAGDPKQARYVQTMLTGRANKSRPDNNLDNSIRWLPAGKHQPSRTLNASWT